MPPLKRAVIIVWRFLASGILILLGFSLIVVAFQKYPIVLFAVIPISLNESNHRWGGLLKHSTCRGDGKGRRCGFSIQAKPVGR